MDGIGEVAESEIQAIDVGCGRLSKRTALASIGGGLPACGQVCRQIRVIVRHASTAGDHADVRSRICVGAHQAARGLPRQLRRAWSGVDNADRRWSPGVEAGRLLAGIFSLAVSTGRLCGHGSGLAHPLPGRHRLIKRAAADMMLIQSTRPAR